MSEVSSNTPKRQAIVNRLRQRIDSFRKHHDTCVARLEETQQSQELKQQQESRIIQSRILENKNKMNSKMRHDQVSIKIPKQEEICSVGQEKPTSNTGLQPTMKRRGDFPPSQIDGERNLPSSEDLGASVPRKYPRFENPNDVHCNLKPSNFTSEGEPLTTKMVYPTVNGHNGEFPKSEELSKAASSYSGAMCENIDRTMTRASQQYGGDFASSTFTNHGQSSVSDKSRTADFPVNFKQENGLINPGNDGSTSITNGFTGSCTKSENLPEYHNTNSIKEDLKLDLKSQISQFERVLQDIKNRDENSSDSESKNDLTVTKSQALQPANPPLGNGLGDNHEVEKGSNQLGLSNGPNNGTQLPTASTTTSTAHQQHGISRSTAEALHQFIRDQQEEKQATKIRYERNLFLNSQGAGREQNATRMTQRANHFPPIRQRVFEQIQQRRTNQQKSKMLGPQAPQLHARNPGMNPLGPNSPLSYQMHPKVRYPSTGMAVSTAQPVTFSPTGRVHQNVMPQIHPASSGQQQQAQAQLQTMPRHQINMIAHQKMAFQQQQMASRLPSYAHAQHLTRPSPMMDIRQKFTPGVPTPHSAQYPLHQQVARTPQPLSHLQHYPNAYPNQSGPPSRPVQPTYTGDYYQNPYAYSVNQENKLHSAYQRHTSVDDNLASNRYNQDIANRNNFSFQRSSSLPGHTSAVKNVFNQTSPPLVRLGQAKPALPDMNNNGNEHQSQELGRSHTQPPLTHVHIKQTNNLTMNQELYQRSGPLNQGRSQTTSNLQQTFSNSFSNLLDLKPNSDSSLFPFFGNEISGGSSDNADFDSLLKSPPSDFDLLNILESEPSKALQ